MRTLRASSPKSPSCSFSVLSCSSFFSLYPLPKEGMQGSNFEKIKAISTVISSITDPWIIMADWNLTPAAVEKSGLPRRLGGKVIRPNVEVTCDKGKGSLIDFALAREDISE